jgi:hypothetical protein
VTVPSGESASSRTWQAEMIGNDVHARWEYRSVTQAQSGYREVDRDEKRRQIEELNALGAEGWEMVTAVPIISEDVTGEIMYVFKRRID